MNLFKKTVALVSGLMLMVIAGCTTTEPVVQCDLVLKAPLTNAMFKVEDKLADGCAFSFENYLTQLIDIAVDNPSADNKRAFSDFLVRVSNRATISKRQARDLYNRYFNVKFVSLAGDYNTCSQVCPTRSRILADMQGELLDKQIGLLQASDDAASYYRADHLLKESQLVLEATCRACEAKGI